MAEERGGMIIGDRVEARLDRLEQGQQILRESVARLEGRFEQMDKRMGEMSSLQKWAIGLIIISWFTLVGMFLVILAKVR